MDNDSVAALYFRGPGEDYASDRRLEHGFQVGAGPQTLSFRIERALGDIEAVDCRIVANTGNMPVAYVKICSVSVATVEPTADRPTPISAAHDRDQLLAGFALHGLCFNDHILGELYIVEDPQAGIEWCAPSGPADGKSAATTVEMVLDYLPDAGYILARDRFIARQEDLEDRTRELQATIALLEDSVKQLEHYQGTALWGSYIRAQALYDRLADAGGQGVLRSSLKLLDPRWWSRRGAGSYERWRAVNGYQNRAKE